MRRWVCLFILMCVPYFAGCGGTYKYMSYEVIRSPEEVKSGDRVRIVSKDGIQSQGTLVRVDGSQLVVAVETRGEQKFLWEEIRVLEKVEQVKAKW